MTINIQFMLERLLHVIFETTIMELENADKSQPYGNPIHQAMTRKASFGAGQTKGEPFPDTSFDVEQNFGACLIVMDDNHYLIEWIAYHYHVANLRHLIITSDPNSRTSPSSVLDRWRDKIVIEEWTSEDFLPTDFGSMVEHRSSGGKRTKDATLQSHRARQAIFNLECMRNMQERGRRWVLLIDSDEYITPNPLLYDDSSDDGRPDVGGQGSVAHILNTMSIPNEDFPDVDTPCVPLHRRQFTTREEESLKVGMSVTDHSLNVQNFQTVRWRKYGAKKQWYEMKNFDVECKRTLRVPNKVVVNVQETNLWHKQNSGNPHRPIAVCPEDVYLKESHTPLVVNHYMGTKEQWMYRRGDKRGLGFRLARYNDINARSGRYTSEDIGNWLNEFVRILGHDEAHRLLANVGEMVGAPPPALSKEELTEEHAYEVGDLVQANYKGDGYWYFAEVVDILPGGFYNLLYEDCSQDLATNEKLMRSHGKVSVSRE
eukprot:CAMPEP_0119555974 /NCGR_PEP_ID=MMETSP1352-20130426/8048_1 /TAXON_ID=265584 /ORGANISM="Stauroneis constricta, Strain CCMP1120" /LENGTH=486 /DNA_ID=CAMNT_0007602851 /DNA_START=82 /DNA_END=1542 /DNA_ORIENTATION=+